MSLANDLMILPQPGPAPAETGLGTAGPVIHSQQATNRALADLVDSILTAEPGDGYQ